MLATDQIASEIGRRVAALPRSAQRQCIAIAGPPGSGKSTLAAELWSNLNSNGFRAGLVAMDGFHLENSILQDRGLRDRKGAPETFDLAGFAALLDRLSKAEEVIAPRFDRDLDVSIGSSVVIGENVDFVVVEGNYLLLDDEGWRDLHAHWALSVFLSVPMAELESRLQRRWTGLGLSAEAARTKVNANDLPNAERVIASSVDADMTF